MIKLSHEVDNALKRGEPVVALESTIIAHGLPFPQNLEMAKDVEQVIRDHGAIPATIAIINGELRAGLLPDELETFARKGQKIEKCSVRDIAYLVAKSGTGATTVASTMRLADMAGIHVFATGGIGGVHRGAGSSFDISNDLTEFTISNVAVVTAGAKAILDLGLTLEVLETGGVPVVGFGTDEFPAFYSRTSGLNTPMRLDNAMEVARMMHAKWSLSLTGGIVIANPIPIETEIPASEISLGIAEALQDARENRTTGKHVTPFLLKRIAVLTEGRSLFSNIALVLNNAKVAAEIAIAYARVQG
jgi:pseudouridylate synthase